MHAYIYAHSQILIYEFPGDGLHDISRLQSQCSDMTFPDQIRYNTMFQQVVHKGGGSEINYIQIIQNTKDLENSVGNSYNEDQMMHTFSYNFQQGGKYFSHIASHQA